MPKAAIEKAVGQPLPKVKPDSWFGGGELYTASCEVSNGKDSGDQASLSFSISVGTTQSPKGDPVSGIGDMAVSDTFQGTVVWTSGQNKFSFQVVDADGGNVKNAIALARTYAPKFA